MQYELRCSNIVFRMFCVSSAVCSKTNISNNVYSCCLNKCPNEIPSQTYSKPDTLYSENVPVMLEPRGCHFYVVRSAMHFNVLRERLILVAVRAKPSVHLLKRRLSAPTPFLLPSSSRLSSPALWGNVEEKRLTCVRPALVACTAELNANVSSVLVPLFH